jgi:1-acyl-sn-glycerol-3-phosphate acyltransferase
MILFLTALRSLIFDLFFYSWTAVASLIASLLVALKVPRPVFLAFAFFWIKSTAAAERFILGLSGELKGFDTLPPAPYIIAAKHQSAWETFKLPLWFDGAVIVLKEQLLRLPLWGPCVRLYGAIPVARSRKASDLRMMLDAATEYAKAGRPIVIFPQGTRVKPGVKKPYHRGVAVLYEHLNIPVVPLRLNSGNFWGRSAFLKSAGVITVEVLPAIPPGLPRDELMARIEAALENEK